MTDTIQLAKTTSETKRTIQPSVDEINDLDLIIPNLFLGNITSAKDSERLEQLNITHVLSIMDSELDFESYKHLEKYKFKQLADHHYANILDVLEECLAFIDEAILESKNILVHCYMGMSRSASLVIAYIMKKEKKSVKEVLAQIRKKRFVKPNMGFYKQLELFYVMQFKVDKSSALFKSYKLENISKHVQTGNQFSDLDSVGEVEEDDENKNVCYKCKKCRYKLFDENNIVPHIKNYSQEHLNSWNKKLAYYRRLDAKIVVDESEKECNSELYIEPLDWFKEKLDSLSGKLNCPKCGAKIGSFDWSGSSCSCKTWVTPAFHISITKVDVCRPLHQSIVKADSSLNV